MFEKFSVDILPMPENRVRNYVDMLRDVFVCDNEEFCQYFWLKKVEESLGIIDDVPFEVCSVKNIHVKQCHWFNWRINIAIIIIIIKSEFVAVLPLDYLLRK